MTEEKYPLRQGRENIMGAFMHEDIGNAMENESSSSNDRASLLRIWTRGEAENLTDWPKWSTLRSRGSKFKVIPLNFTLRIQDSVVHYTKASTQEGTAAQVFDDAVSYITSIREILSGPGSDHKLEDALIDQMTMVVYGSNFIERTGLGLEETIQLCRHVFGGEIISNIPPRFAEYLQKLEQVVQESQQSLPQTTIRDRREVVNHAGALMYMIDRVITNDEMFSEELLRSTHKILVRGVDCEHREGPPTPSDKYAGIYRNCHVAAGENNFVNPTFVPKAMKRFVDELNTILLKAEKEEELDPFYIAAHAAGEFVNIHPFLDGNGRTCRLILNTILLKYAGILAPIGEYDYEREEYLQIAKQRSAEECGNGELVFYILRKASQALKSLSEKLTVD